MLMGVVQTQRRLLYQVTGIRNGQRSMCLDQPGEIDPVNELHRQIENVVCFSGIGRPDDVGMVEASDDFDFPGENGPQAHGSIGTSPRQNLEGDQTVQPLVPRLVNRTHAARTDLS